MLASTKCQLIMQIVNLTAFRKALKKFEKTTNIHCLEMFTQERISGETFAKGEDVEEMLKSVEELFTKRFEHGNIKKARSRLRERDMGYTVSDHLAVGFVMR